jgi:hypothetical protein
MKKPASRLSVRIFSRKSFDTEKEASVLMDYLVHNPRFSPNRYGEFEPRSRLADENYSEVIKMIINKTGQELNSSRISTSVVFERSEDPKCVYRVEWSRLPHRAFDISNYSIHQEYISEEEMLSSWLDYSMGLVAIHDAWFSIFALGTETHEKNFLTWYTQHPRAKDPKRGITNQRGIGFDLMQGIPGVYWGNYYGPFYVDWFGHEKFDDLPCLKRSWLDNGGMFFTTAESPFDWNTPNAVRVQQTVKEHLGTDAFFDIQVIREALAEIGPIPEIIKPEQLQPPRRIPEFPFKMEAPEKKPFVQEVEEARQYFESQGFSLESLEGNTITFSDETGGITKVTVGPGGKVEYYPKG